MDSINKAMDMMAEKFRAEFGEDIKLEDDDEIVGVFNDATVIMSLEDGNLKVKVLIGAPYKFDFNLNVLG